MTGWTAIVPIKPEQERKTRLAADVDRDQRILLTELMLHRVLETLSDSGPVGEILLLGAAPHTDGRFGWIRDQGRGLNAELADAVRGLARVLVVHADLPSLCPADIEAMVEAADQGIAIAPDHSLTGTNALGFRGGEAISFCFGVGSFPKHLAMAAGRARPVNRPGLAFDIDMPNDIEAAVRNGALPPGCALGRAAGRMAGIVVQRAEGAGGKTGSARLRAKLPGG